jgi:dihydrofolate synthase / folylpolyglutamate synthase
LSTDRVQSLQSLADWLSYLERLHPSAIDMGLDRVATVRDRLGLAPAFAIISVAGTNGKGSVCAMLESVLASAGYRTGRYVSPHLLRYNERVRIAGREATDADLIGAFSRIERARGEISLTYFEFGTLAALDLFIRAGVEVAILEVGMGGRLDAVNAFDADCAVVTSIGLDHMDYLGPDRESIGLEKAGIFRADRPAVCGDEDPPESLLAHAQAVGARLDLIGRDFGFRAEPGQWQFWSAAGRRSALPYPALRGAYQLSNAATVLATLERFRQELPVDMGAIRRGLLDVELPGRFQVLPGRPMVILDVGHNPHAARGLAVSLRTLPRAGRTLAVFAMLRDKDIEGVVAEVKAGIDQWFVAALPGPRGAGVERMAQAVAGIEAPVAQFDTPAAAYQQAIRSAGQDDRILVFGSFYTMTAVLQLRG